MSFLQVYTGSEEPHLRATCVREDRVPEPRPRVLHPIAERPVGEAREGEPGLGVDPEERAAAAEVAERRGRVPRARPVRLLAVADLEAETPVVRLHAAEAREDADEAREGDGRRLAQRLGRDEARREEVPAECGEVVERAVDSRRRGAAEPWAEPELLEDRGPQMLVERTLRGLGQGIGHHRETRG